MTPEDEKRLAGIRTASSPGHPAGGASNDEVLWLLAKLDESERARTEAEKENVRIAKQSAENRARAVRVEAALDYEKRIHTQTTAALAEERAKREAAEQQERQDVLQAEASAADSEREAVRERERADRAEAALRDGELRKREDYFPEVANLRQRNRDMHDRAQKAEVALAEERAQREFWNTRMKAVYDAEQPARLAAILEERTAAEEIRDNWERRYVALNARAETVEARVAELEKAEDRILTFLERECSRFNWNSIRRAFKRGEHLSPEDILK